MKHVHLIGIGGSGLSAIARVLLESGYTVSGSDRQSSPLAEGLEVAGARFYLGHQPENVSGADLVVRSSAVRDDNVEVQAALSKGIPVLKRAEFLGQILADRKVVAVAGTHGKTSTTAMIAWMLTKMGHHPGFIVGSVVTDFGVNAHAGVGSIFVIEADEYDRMFLGLRPQIAVVTNVEHDHPDCYPSPEDFSAAFQDFVERVEPGGLLLACGDDPGALDLVSRTKSRNVRLLTYGIYNSQNIYQAHNLEIDSSHGGYQFDILLDKERLCQIVLKVPGVHNVQNALAALAVADQMGLPVMEAAKALSSFQGTARRFEIVGEAQGVIVVSDYAHHPTEIRATLAAARTRYPEREIWAVWQPHTYTRTHLLFDEFATSFENADHILVTEIYYAREPHDPYFSSKEVVRAMEYADSRFVPDLTDVVQFLLDHLHSGAVLLVLSAGDADQICGQVLTGLRKKQEIKNA
jgi:UDP-N-acetylmuramate--alanine ligase